MKSSNTAFLAAAVLGLSLLGVPGGAVFTYTNAVVFNKLVLVPQYGA